MGLHDKLPQTSDRYAMMQRFRAREAWHVMKILSEFVESAEELQTITPAVSIFGSARTPRDHPYYKLTEDVARAAVMGATGSGKSTLAAQLVALAESRGLRAVTLSLDDLVTTAFLSGPGSTTLPQVIFSKVRLGVSPEVNALASIIIGIVALGVIIATLKIRKGMKNGG